MIITIDGPAGSGKSTLAARLAGRLNITYLDTGAMYRAVTLAALRRNVPLDNPQALAELADTCCIDFEPTSDGSRVLLDNQDVTDDIRTPDVTTHSHKIADPPAVREILVRQQRLIARRVGSLVTEGRDQGTVVFPDTPFKFYLDASPECRARRRWLQLKQKDPSADYDEILHAQNLRDQRDARRPVGGLKIPPNAVVIDTTDLSIEQVLDTLIQYIQEIAQQCAHGTGHGNY